MIRALAAEPENAPTSTAWDGCCSNAKNTAKPLPYLEKAVKNLQSAGDETLWEHLGMCTIV